MRIPLAFAAASALVAACTFPDVDYADGGTDTSSSSSSGSTSSSGASSSSGSACAVPMDCASTAMSCSDLADNKQKGCLQPCKTNQACISACNTTWNKELSMCAAACDSCAAATCAGMTTNCNALVGL